MGVLEQQGIYQVDGIYLYLYISCFVVVDVLFVLIPVQQSDVDTSPNKTTRHTILSTDTEPAGATGRYELRISHQNFLCTSAEGYDMKLLNKNTR